MGDKSPKNTRKSGKQKSDAQATKENKKIAAETGVQPLVLGGDRRR